LQLFGDSDVLSLVRKSRMNWIGHTINTIYIKQVQTHLY